MNLSISSPDQCRVPASNVPDAGMRRNPTQEIAMFRSATLFALAFAASTAAIVQPAHSLKPGFEKPTKTCTVKKICVQGHPLRSGGWGCTKYKEVKICD